MRSQTWTRPPRTGGGPTRRGSVIALRTNLSRSLREEIYLELVLQAGSRRQAADNIEALRRLADELAEAHLEHRDPEFDPEPVTAAAAA